MKVIYVGPLPPQLGGATFSSFQILKSLARLGWSVRAVGPATPERREECEAVARAHPEIAFHRYTVPQYPEDPSQPRPAGERIAEEQAIAALLDQLAAGQRPDLILAGREVESRAIPAVAAPRRIPWVLRCGGYVLHLLEKGWLRSVPEPALRRAIGQAEAAVVQAEHLVPAARAAGCRRVTVIPCPVDLALFAPRDRPAALCQGLGISPGVPVIFHASDMKPVKRAEDIVESAPAVLARYPDAVYLIVGDGPARASLEQRCRQLGIAGQFRFTGRMDYERMPELFALADIVLMPSAFEQQARVYLEAQASACLLVASGVEGARSVVEDGVTGLLFPAGGVEALAGAILRALADPDLRSAIGHRARLRAQAHSLELVAARIATLLEDVVRSYRPFPGGPLAGSPSLRPNLP